MFYRLLFLISVSLIITGCAHHPAVVIPVSPSRALPTFNHIAVNGQFNLKLHTGASKSLVRLYGDSRDIAQVVMLVTNKTLVLSFNPGYPKFGQVKADIHTRYLNSLTYHGVGTISGKHIHSGLLDLILANPGPTTLDGTINLRRLDVIGPGAVTISGVKSQHLQLVMKGNPRIQLNGIIGLSAINMDGNGSLGLHWIKSNNLIIRARGKSSLKLAGTAQKLDVELWDSAFFNGRYLQTYDLFVKTHGKSVAEINARGKQHTLATDASDIYFYNLPEMRADLMADNGAVLDMRDWNTYFLQHYTRYNRYYTSNS